MCNKINKVNFTYMCRLYKSMPKYIKNIFSTACFLLFIKIFLNQFNAPCDFIYFLGNAFENLILAVISSVIFYFFINHIKFMEEKNLASPIRKKFIEQLKRDNFEFLEGFSVGFRPSFKIDATRKEWITMDKIIEELRAESNPESFFPKSVSSSIHFKWMVYHLGSNKNLFNLLLIQSKYLEKNVEFENEILLLNNHKFTQWIEWLISDNEAERNVDVKAFEFYEVFMDYFNKLSSFCSKYENE